MSTSADLVTIGLDIGGTKVLGVVVDDAGNVVREVRRPSPVNELGALVAVCARMVDELAEPGAAVGVGAAGLVDRRGRLTYAPNIPGVRNAPLRDELLRVLDRPVVVDNDANTAALCEVTYGAAAGARHAVMVTLGTGIGGGFIFDGKVYRGANGFAAGEGEAILAAAHGDLEAVSGEEVAAAAAMGDPNACALLARYADNVALGLANLANILDPERIVIAGGLVSMGALLFDPLLVAFRDRLEGTEYRPEIPIVPAALGERAGAVGAAVLARTASTS